ncbi:hypothetical protein KC19_2G149300 [Ceratodon purpureus]|uniref:Uncharacterized protein n=1 Tax=Ceratodon purpureus TaxID=3225 RepID=A0A8T0IU24_CERPU|nr:hypothetical protein KC19_2G149300 [Ceratodon purpureus]
MLSLSGSGLSESRTMRGRLTGTIYKQDSRDLMPHIVRKTKITTTLFIYYFERPVLLVYSDTLCFHKASVSIFYLFSYIALSTGLVSSSCQVILTQMLEMLLSHGFLHVNHFLRLQSRSGLCLR